MATMANINNFDSDDSSVDELTPNEYDESFNDLIDIEDPENSETEIDDNQQYDELTGLPIEEVDEEEEAEERLRMWNIFQIKSRNESIIDNSEEFKKKKENKEEKKAVKKLVKSNSCELNKIDLKDFVQNNNNLNVKKDPVKGAWQSKRMESMKSNMDITPSKSKSYKHTFNPRYPPRGYQQKSYFTNQPNVLQMDFPKL